MHGVIPPLPLYAFMAWTATTLSFCLQILNYVKIRPVGVELFHVDGRTDGRADRQDEAKSRFQQRERAK